MIRKPQKIHSRARARDAAEAKSKGRHMGYGARCRKQAVLPPQCQGPRISSCCLVPIDLESCCWRRRCCFTADSCPCMAD